MTVSIYKPELLAPAGRKDVFFGVIDAGADAVYVSGKQFNMRRHRSDYHFRDSDLAELCAYAHERNAKLYVTVNILIGDHELPSLINYLHTLNDIGIDAIIVQDFSVPAICRKENLTVPLHASTMMNVSTAEGALLLKEQGFTRVVTSRDITVHDVKAIKDNAGIEVEYFIHGDMCTAQSGQCYGSGILFGKSGNRGQCMKPCRWAFDLMSEKTGERVRQHAYLLASKDMCLIEHVPDLINAGVSSLKIEGRMKSRDVLMPIVAAYRAAIDAYITNPLSYARDSVGIRSLYQNRVRDFTTGFSFKTPGSDYIDYTGEREPLFMSYAGIQNVIQDYTADLFNLKDDVKQPATPEITCIAGTYETARTALDNGARTIILSWEGDLRIDSAWNEHDIRALSDYSRTLGRRVLFNTPKIITAREMTELQRAVRLFPEIDTWVMSTPAPLRFLQKQGKNIWADYTCNIINSYSAGWFAEQGVERIMPSLESSFEDVRDMVSADPSCTFDVLIHGPLSFMTIEHCIVGMNLQQVSKKDFCKMPCAADDYYLTDTAGNRFRIRTDKYCRNHIFFEHDVTVLPALNSFLALGATSVRIDARLYSQEKTAALVKLFHDAVHDKTPDIASYVERLYTISNNEQFSYGAYERGIVSDTAQSRYALKKEGIHA